MKFFSLKLATYLCSISLLAIANVSLAEHNHSDTIGDRSYSQHDLRAFDPELSRSIESVRYQSEHLNQHHVLPTDPRKSKN